MAVFGPVWTLSIFEFHELFAMIINSLAFRQLLRAFVLVQSLFDLLESSSVCEFFIL